MPRTHRPCALVASAGLLISAHAAHAQFDTFTGDIQLDAVPVVSLGFDFMGTLALASIANPVDVGGFDAELAVTPGATITHTGDLLISPGLNTLAIFRLGSGASWTTTGTLDHGSGTNLSGLLNLDTDASLTVGGDFVMANNPGSGALFSALAGSATVIGGDFIASSEVDSFTSVSMEGAGSTLDISGSFDMGSGDASFGTLELFEGVVASVDGDFTMGSGSNSSFDLYVGDDSEFHIGGHAAFGQGLLDSSLDINVDTAGTLTSGSMSISGRSGSFGTGAELNVDNGSSLQTGALTISEGARFIARSGSTVNAGETTAEGANTSFRALGGSQMQVASLTIADEANVRVNQGSTLEIAGDLTLVPQGNVPIAVNGANSLLSIGGDIIGDSGLIDFNAGTIQLGGDFTITDDLDGGFRNFNGNRSLTVGGLLGVESSVTLSSGSTVRAGRMTEAGINDFASGTGDLIVDAFLLENAGQTTTTLPAFTTTATLIIAGVQNDGVLEAAFLDAYPDLGIVNAVSGTVTLGAGDDAITPWIENSGVIEIIGADTPAGSARHQITGAFDNKAGGMISLSNAELRAFGGLSNEGTLTIGAGDATIFGDTDNTGTLSITADTALAIFDNLTNNGVIETSPDGAIALFGDYSGAGDVTGGGAISLLGGVSVGNSPADVFWDASLSFGPTTDTIIEIAGTGAGLFDRITITGDFNIAGDLEVAFLDGFLLEEGMRFDVFNVASTRSGAFNGLQEGALVGTYNGVDLFITYDNLGFGNVALFSVPAPGAATLLFCAGLLTRRRRA